GGRRLRVLAPALGYFGIVFAAGFVLGAIRSFWLEPVVGAFWAVALEMPVILGFSWVAATWVVRRFAISSAGTAILTGVMAFAFLVCAEIVLSMSMGGSFSSWTSEIKTSAGLLGLAGQILYAAFPLVVVARSRPDQSP
ncbi:MAG: hypothetical protein V2I43_22050, partial [Parvularcula sp.]|nr:hypothetical protein [Parvularcula sp.]